MVLGLRSKSRKSVAFQVDYLIHVQQIKPWPQSLRSAQSLLVQWENNDSSGYFPCSAEDGMIVIGESFKLSVTLCKETSKRRSSSDSFQKNCLEFSLYESLKNRAVKGQLLGSAVINLADYGVIRETANASIPVSCKKSLKNVAQPMLYISIQPCDVDSSSSSPKSGLSKEVSLEKPGSGSVSTQGNDEDVKISSFTDDDLDGDVPVHSSLITSTSLPENVVTLLSQDDKREPKTSDNGKQVANREDALLLEVATSSQEKHFAAEASERGKAIFSSPSTDLLDTSNSAQGLQDMRELHIEETTSLPKPRAYKLCQRIPDESNGIREGSRAESEGDVFGSFSNGSSSNAPNSKGNNNTEFLRSTLSRDHESNWSSNKDGLSPPLHVLLGSLTVKDENEQKENGLAEHTLKKKKHFRDVASGFLKRDTRKEVAFLRDAADEIGDFVDSNELKHEKDVNLLSNPSDNFKLPVKSAVAKEVKWIHPHKDDDESATFSAINDKKKLANFSANEAKLENRIAMLEEELREAAAIEASLYSVIAEHGSSSNKVHSPARRLSRFYFHACKLNSPSKRESAARAVVSGLVLVSKACGNDVPRLTFWLSNAIMLRAIITLAAGKLLGEECGRNNVNKETSVGSSVHGIDRYDVSEHADVWENPLAFTVALEGVENWIFLRIVESVWWQTVTPHMQPSAAKGSNSKKIHGNFSVDLWKKAFKDARERLCPIRAGGHECGCLPLLARLVMEQLVGRLDVAMFNAILRGSDDEMPTDPVSDPISDSKVLPIPAGKSGFRPAIQLKNAIGNWSRWLADLFDIDEDDSPEDRNKTDGIKKQEGGTSFKAFPLLNALSDLMKLPLDMLADRSARKEYCPVFGVPLIVRILNNFVPDEYSPDPVPEALIETLDSEDHLDEDEQLITSIPHIASPIAYTPPPASSLGSVIGEMGNQTLSRTGSSVLRKSYTSDDELDELDSPIGSIIHDGGRVSPSSTLPNWMLERRKIVRYRLLKEVWQDGE
ncbi:uncharacterized protein LOC115738907 isoform X2 [Rhodamnia argentea]|uniref:Uncharacterized protein LOC115738907 isoform X2 n=1 Tax=Rhodamnia argentea TaxID=178133 RepID=A0A8B8NYE3_9MYRT|nr:uncharacterized protein LOC115738907 isoform X2 [Rhodamnia argentea]